MYLYWKLKNKTAGSKRMGQHQIRMGQHQIQSDKCCMNPSVSKLFLETCGPLKFLDLTPLYFHLWVFERHCVNKQPKHRTETKYSVVHFHCHWRNSSLSCINMRERVNACIAKHYRHTQHLTFWHQSFTFNSNKSPTWCNNFSVYYPDVCLQLNMFRAFSRPSSRAQWLQWQPLVLPSYRGDSHAVFVVGPDHEHSTAIITLQR